MAILIVYNESEVPTMLAEMLAVHGHRVETAGNGVIALGKPRLRAYDVIPSDLRMPAPDGLNLYWQVARDRQEFWRPVISLTGNTLSPEKPAFAAKTGASIGLRLAVVVTAASVQDRDWAMYLVAVLRHKCSRLRLLWTDHAYAGELIAWVWAHRLWRKVQGAIVKRPEGTKSFQLLPKWWIVERTVA